MLVLIFTSCTCYHWHHAFHHHQPTFAFALVILPTTHHHHPFSTTNQPTTPLSSSSSSSNRLPLRWGFRSKKKTPPPPLHRSCSEGVGGGGGRLCYIDDYIRYTTMNFQCTFFFFFTTPFIICVVPPLEAYRLIMTPLIIFNLYVTTPSYITIIHIILQVGGSVRGIAHCPGLYREDFWPFTSRRSLLVSVVCHRKLRHRPPQKKTKKNSTAAIYIRTAIQNSHTKHTTIDYSLYTTTCDNTF